MSAPTSHGGYLICATPRTGSTLLCGLLRSTGVAGRPESYFRAPDEDSWDDRWELPRTGHGSFDHRDYVRAAAAAGRTGNGVFAARVMWGTVGEMVAKLRAAHPWPPRTDPDVLRRALGPLHFVDMPCVTGGILRFLGLHLPATQDVVPGHRRQADEVNH